MASRNIFMNLENCPLTMVIRTKLSFIQPSHGFETLLKPSAILLNLKLFQLVLSALKKRLSLSDLILGEEHNSNYFSALVVLIFFFFSIDVLFCSLKYFIYVDPVRHSVQ